MKNLTEKQRILRELQTIPGVGRSIAEDLYNLGYVSVADLKDREPLIMYERLCSKAGQHLDRCLLYTFRCAVYYASHKKHDPEKLKWWNWKTSEDEEIERGERHKKKPGSNPGKKRVKVR